MKIYETGFLLAPNLSEDDTEKLITQMADVIAQREGKLIKQEKFWLRGQSPCELYPPKFCYIAVLDLLIELLSRDPHKFE